MQRDREALAAVLRGYTVGEELGRGGWGIVFAAVQERLNRQVAVKMLPRAFAADLEVRARFEEEAQFAARLSHPHIVPVYDLIDADGVLAIVMERLTPRTLADRFVEEGWLQDSACALGIVIGSALHAAHRLGRVHRDVKPENVLFDNDDVPKLSDFGVAKIIGLGDGLTRAGEVIGTPAYMSPEQATGRTVGAASDVYAAGVLVYELLAGCLPFPPASTAVAQLYQHVHEKPVPLLSANPDVAPEVARAVMRALAKDPAQRYESAEAFALAIAQGATEAYGSDCMRHCLLDVRLTGRLVNAFRQTAYGSVAQRMPALTRRTIIGPHPRLGTFYETGQPTVLPAGPDTGMAAVEVAGFALLAEHPPTRLDAEPERLRPRPGGAEGDVNHAPVTAARSNPTIAPRSMPAPGPVDASPDRPVGSGSGLGPADQLLGRGFARDLGPAGGLSSLPPPVAEPIRPPASAPPSHRTAGPSAGSPSSETLVGDGTNGRAGRRKRRRPTRPGPGGLKAVSKRTPPPCLGGCRQSRTDQRHDRHGDQYAPQTDPSRSIRTTPPRPARPNRPPRSHAGSERPTSQPGATRQLRGGLPGPSGDEQGLADGTVAGPRGHLLQHLELAFGKPLQHRRFRPGVIVHQRVDHLRIDHRAALRDPPHCCGELVAIADPLLEEVCPSFRPILEQPQCIRRLDVLAQDDDTDRRVARPEKPCGANALVGLTRWHSTVGDHHIWSVFVHRCD